MISSVFWRQLAIFGIDAAVDQNTVSGLRVRLDFSVQGRQRREELLQVFLAHSLRSLAFTLPAYPIPHHTANPLRKQVWQTRMYVSDMNIENALHIPNLQTVTVLVAKNSL